VVAAPETPARRELRPHVATKAAAGEDEVDAYPRAQACAAALALAGSTGLSSDALYLQVFGATYDPARHDGLLRTTVYRARRHVAQSATLDRRGDRWVLEPTAGFEVVDPRCASSSEDHLLAWLAAQGRPATAREISDSLGAPLRTIQEALRALLLDGSIETRKDGRSSIYYLEDTTFSEPSLSRLAPRQG
jgi:hypothetical protein